MVSRGRPRRSCRDPGALCLPPRRAVKSGMERGLYTISADASFLDELAAGLRRIAGDDPLALARMVVLLPTRRACRALREAFLREGEGTPMLLPRMRPVGDLEADELSPGAAEFDVAPAIPDLRRR